MSSHAIDEIEERLSDLTSALREAGAPDVAQMLERRTRDFTLPTRVRRSVNAIREQLERWRLDSSELPDSPKVMLAANRLEDACRDALAAGVIVAARPTLAAQSRRKLKIVLFTLLGAGIAMAIPLLAVSAGVDFGDLVAERKLPPLSLPRGEEATVHVSVLARALLPQATRGVAFQAQGGCEQPLPREATCALTVPRLWAEGRLPTYELKLKNQAYGLLFSVAGPKLEDGIGVARLLLAATDDTPEGRYELPLRATYLGYTPQRCELLDRLQGSCPKPRTGEGERHPGLEVPSVIVDVVHGDPARRMGEKRREQAEAEEARRKAEERARQIAAAVSEIQAVLGQTEKLAARRRWETARDSVGKLAKLFEPLEGVVLTQTANDKVPAQVSAVRARFETLRDKLEAFENRVFEQTFAAVTAASNRRVPEDSLLQRIARRNGISADYVRDIYTSRGDEIQRRIDARAEAHMESVKRAQEALEQHCGPLPTGAWEMINRYMQQVYVEPQVEVVLGECMTPRLTERDCWEMRCTYKRKVEVAVERPKVVTSHETTFYLMHGRVTGHRNES